ncbi:MAG: TRAP transporter substrate-binding protein [Deferrisomatales bacterium]
MRKRSKVLAVALAGAALAVSALGSPATAAESTMHLKFSTWHPPASREVKTVWTPMLEELKKRSNGRITYTLYAGGALGSGPEHYDIVKNGLSDMGYFTATWTPGRFPLSDVLSLATWTDGKDVSTKIGNKMHDQVLHKEFEGVKVLELNGCIQAFLWTKKPVKTLEDVKGLKVRSPGGHQTNYIKAIGAEPVFMPLGDVYLALETGTIDGVVTCSPLVLAFKLAEVVKHGVVATFGCVTEGVVMNQKSWDKTPDDLKPIIAEVVGNPFATTHGLNRDVYKTMIDDIKAKGVTLYELPAAEQARWAAKFQEETKKWVADLSAKGVAAKDAVVMYNKIATEAGSKCEAFPTEWH